MNKALIRQLYATLLGVDPKGMSGKELLNKIKSHKNSASLLKVAQIARQKLSVQESPQAIVERVLSEIVDETSDEVEKSDDDETSADAKELAEATA